VTPESIEVQLARLDEQLKAVRQIVEAARFIADNVHRNSERLAVHEERFNDMHSDIAALEGRMESAVSRVESSCNNLGELIRQTSATVTKVESEQRTQTETISNRQRGLWALAGTFGTGALVLLGKLLGVG
jgi:peptidoglycan hydrolase CwlO-like protein